MWALNRIAVALEELVRIHQTQEARLNRHDVERAAKDAEERDQMATYTKQMERAVAVAEASRKDNQEHLAKCERRYLARLAGDEVPDEVKY